MAEWGAVLGTAAEGLWLLCPSQGPCCWFPPAWQLFWLIEENSENSVLESGLWFGPTLIHRNPLGFLHTVWSNCNARHPHPFCSGGLFPGEE